MGTSRNIERDRAIGARICLARIRLGMSRPALAGRISVSVRRVARFERGESGIPAAMLEDLGATLRQEPTFFLASDASAADAIEQALTEVETVALPEPGTAARRHFDEAVIVLRGRVPFGSAAPAAQLGGAAA